MSFFNSKKAIGNLNTQNETENLVVRLDEARMEIGKDSLKTAFNIIYTVIHQMKLEDYDLNRVEDNVISVNGQFSAIIKRRERQLNITEEEQLSMRYSKIRSSLLELIAELKESILKTVGDTG